MKIMTFQPLVSILFIAALLSSCGGSNGSSNPLTASATITYPPDASLVDATTLQVSGTAADRGNVVAVRVNGVAATSSDDFAHWTAAVPLVRGQNTLTVELTDGDDNVHANLDTLQIQNELFSPSLSSPVVDSDNNRLISIDSFRRSLISIDIDTGEREIFSGSGSPDEVNPFLSPRGMVLDAVNNRLLVLDSIRIFAVDLTTGARTIISDSLSPNSGPAISGLTTNMALDEVNNRLLLNNIMLIFNPLNPLISPDRAMQVLTVDLTTGLRSLLSAEGLPNDDNPFNNLSMIVVDTIQNRAIVVDSVANNIGDNRLLGVDLITGERELVSSATFPSNNTPIFSPLGLAIDSLNNRALVLGANQDLVEVNLNTGARSIAVEAEQNISVIGFNATILLPNAITFNQTTGKVFSSSALNSLIEVVDLNSGGREPLTNMSHVPDDNNAFLSPRSIHYDRDNSRTLVLDFNERILSIDESGARDVVYEDTSPVFNPFANTTQIGSASAIVGSTFYYFLQFNTTSINRGDSPPFVATRLVAVDLETDTVETISSDDDAQLLDLDFPLAMVIDGETNVAYVLNQDGILSVNMDTGERNLFAEAPEVSVGPMLISGAFTGIALDKENNRLLATGLTRNLIAIDLNTQNQSLLSPAPTNDIAVFGQSNIPMLLDPDRNRLLLIHLREIEAVDLDSGERTHFAGDNAEISTSPLLSPSSMTLDETNDRILVLDSVMRAVYSIDPNSGQRAIISR